MASVLDRFSKDKALEALKQTVRRLLSARGQVNARGMATRLIEQYQALDGTGQAAFFAFLAQQFNPDPQAVLKAAQAYAELANPQTLIDLFTVVEPERQELLRRINRAPGGTKAVIEMRHALLNQMRARPAWRSIDADMHHLLSSWFNPGFLQLEQITWNSPASLLEKIIQHESVHAIAGWDDLHRRLQPDRRCYAFFHDRLPGEPLIFVEVALVPSISSNVGALIDTRAPVGEAKSFKTAIFYSISNCQPGLRGVSLGNFLIKRVAEKLLQDIPSLKQFSTLSPIPGLLNWLDQGATLPQDLAIKPTALKHLERARQTLGLPSNTPAQVWGQRIRAGWRPDQSNEQEQAALMHLCAQYLMLMSVGNAPDPVAQFHLSNGATLHQINWAADVSPKGLQQSAGIMVNYLYELDKVEQQHEAFSQKTVVSSRQMQRW